MKSDTHFMIIDDYANIRTLIRGQLNDFGITENISEFETADAAMEFLKSNPVKPVEFIISDWNMPGTNGLDFLKWARTQDKLKNIPFLILTTQNEQSKIMTAIQAGVSNFLLKPWEAEELASKINLSWKKHHP